MQDGTDANTSLEEVRSLEDVRCAECDRLLAEGRMSAPEPGDHPAQVLASYLLLALRHEVLGQTVLAEELRKATDTLHQVFPASFGKFKGTLKKYIQTHGASHNAERIRLISLWSIDKLDLIIDGDSISEPFLKIVEKGLGDARVEIRKLASKILNRLKEWKKNKKNKKNGDSA